MLSDAILSRVFWQILHTYPRPYAQKRKKIINFDHNEPSKGLGIINKNYDGGKHDVLVFFCRFLAEKRKLTESCLKQKDLHLSLVQSKPRSRRESLVGQKFWRLQWRYGCFFGDGCSGCSQPASISPQYSLISRPPFSYARR